MNNVKCRIKEETPCGVSKINVFWLLCPNNINNSIFLYGAAQAASFYVYNNFIIDKSLDLLKSINSSLETTKGASISLRFI